MGIFERKSRLRKRLERKGDLKWKKPGYGLIFLGLGTVRISPNRLANEFKADDRSSNSARLSAV